MKSIGSKAERPDIAWKGIRDCQMRQGENAKHLRRNENEVAKILQLGKSSILSDGRSYVLHMALIFTPLASPVLPQCLVV